MNYKVTHNYLFEFDKLRENLVKMDIRQLSDSDLPLFIDYFKINNPEVKNINWLDDYFLDMCSEGLCFGSFENDTLVSLAECPDMPFMSDRVRHIGISTLKDYTSKGYAKQTVIKSIKNLLIKNITPQWECSFDNEGSKKIAKNVGFKKIADCLIVS